MKTLKFILLIFTCFGLIMGCSKDEDLIENQDEMMLKKASKAPVFVVEPTGVDDTENLKNAFADARAAGNGSVVKLVEGEYHIDLIEVKEFHGTLMGAGKGKTVISTVEDLNVDAFLNQNLTTLLLSFIGGDVCVRSLTIRTPEGPLSTGMKPWIHGQLGFSSISANYVANNEYINAVVEHVEFISEGYVRNGLLAESNFWKKVNGFVPIADMDISFANCSFTGPYSGGTTIGQYSYGVLVMEIREGKVVAGNKGKRNVFNNCDLGIWHNINTMVTVQGNKLIRNKGWFPLQIINGPYREDPTLYPQTFQSVCKVENNEVFATECIGGAIINDFRRRCLSCEYELPMLVQVKNNKIHTEGGMKTAMACLNMNGMVIRNNKFTGEAQFGLRIFPQSNELYSDNGLILGNNFSNSEYSETTVLLGEGTRNWTIVGGSIGQNVTDLGENNLISGFNNNTSDVPFGQTIVDNLKEIKSPMRDLE